MNKVIERPCGYVVRAESDEELIARVQECARRCRPWCCRTFVRLQGDTTAP